MNWSLFCATNAFPELPSLHLDKPVVTLSRQSLLPHAEAQDAMGDSSVAPVLPPVVASSRNFIAILSGLPLHTGIVEKLLRRSV